MKLKTTLSSFIIGKPFLIANCIRWDIICKYWFIGLDKDKHCVHTVQNSKNPLEETVTIISSDPPCKNDNV